jgi:hypothetical protein
MHRTTFERVGLPVRSRGISHRAAGYTFNKEVAMNNEKIVHPDFRNHSPFRVPDALHGTNVEADSGEGKSPSAAGSAGRRTTDDLAPETDSPRHNDAGVRIREYAITPGRVLRTLEKVTGPEETAGNLRLVR